MDHGRLTFGRDLTLGAIRITQNKNSLFAWSRSKCGPR